MKSSSPNHGHRRHTALMAAVIVLIIALIPVVSVTAGVQLENHDAFCASCHTEPESTYVQRAHAVVQGEKPADLASYHAGLDQPVTCIDCHSGKGWQGRLDAMKTGSKDLMAFVSRHYDQPAPLTRAIADANCLKCHGDISDKQTFDNHFHFFLPQWQQIAADRAAHCVDCHTTHPQDGQSEIAFLNKAHTVKQCDACHRVAGEG